MSFFKELQRRNVIRIAILYVVAAGFILQGADLLTSVLQLPAWSSQLVFMFLALGFIPALLFSWVYELTPEGLKRETDVNRDQSVPSETGRKIDRLVAILLVLAIASIWLGRLIPDEAPAGPAAPAEEIAEPTAAGTTAVPVDAAGIQSSIAVLPFINMSSDVENEYFSDGLSEELLNLLAKIPELQVAARTSSFTFKDRTDADIAEIARKLGVANVLEGSVRKSGNTVRITAQLIEAERGFHLWSETYDRSLDDIFAVQDEIAAAIVNTLELTLLDSVPESARTDSKAYSLYLRALTVGRQYSADALDESIELFRQALGIDPDYAPAWSRLATTWINKAQLRLVPYDVGFENAKIAANKAVSLDPNLGTAHASLCFIHLFHGRDVAQAAFHIKRAMQLAPDELSVLGTSAMFAAYLGHPQRAAEIYERTVNLDPLSVSGYFNLSLSYLDSRNPDKAESNMRQALALSPQLPSVHYLLGRVAMIRGDMETALAEFSDEADELNRLQGQAMAYHGLGRREDSDAALQKIISEIVVDEDQAAAAIYDLAGAYAFRGEPDIAFERLQKAHDIDAPQLVQMRADELFTSVRDDPRWQELLHKLGLSDEQLAGIGL